jgi:hypothetical protein
MTSQIQGASAGVIAVVAQVSFALGILLGLAYPVLLLIFMTRPKIVEAFNSPQLQETI